MGCCKIDSGNGRFVHNFRMVPDTGQREELEQRFRAAQQCYNACLNEALRRVKLMRDSKVWQRACDLPRDNDERPDLFDEAREKYELTGDRALQSYVKSGKPGWNDWLQEHIDSQVARKMAKRAYHAVNDWLLGEKGKPGFKGWFEFRSVEGGGKPNGQSIRFLDGNMVWSANRNKLMIPCIVPKGEHAQYALAHDIKFNRIIRRRVEGGWEYDVQLVLEGKPLNERDRGKQVIGIDPGIGKFGIVGDDWAHLVDITAPLKQQDDEVRRLQRKADRQLRENNPQCFDEDGCYIKGTKITNRTNGWKKTQGRIREAERRLSETRKSLHGCVINAIIENSDRIVVEQNSFEAFQRNYGKHMRRSAPGEFIERLKRKADELGITIINAAPYDLKPSQFCHNCGSVKKKNLSNRVHECECGIGPMQRDLYSAWLLRSVELENSNWVFDMGQLREDWSGAEPRLQAGVDAIKPRQFAEAVNVRDGQHD